MHKNLWHERTGEAQHAWRRVLTTNLLLVSSSDGGARDMGHLTHLENVKPIVLTWALGHENQTCAHLMTVTLDG